MLFALQRYFNCLPYITLMQVEHMDTLERMINEGSPLDENQQKDLARLNSLPNQLPNISDILGLTPPECREWKRLKGYRENGEKMTPEQLQRYRFLKDKIRKA